MFSGWRLTTPPACLVALLASCGAPPAAEGPPRLSPGARDLLISEADLGKQARTLLPNLEADPFVYFRFINRPWARAA